MDLGRHVVDKEILDCDGLRGGKVDDLLLELEGPTGHGLPAPEVVAIISGPLALARNLPRPLYWLAHQVYRLLGVTDAHPVEIPWERVTAIDVVVHTDVHRGDVGLSALPEAVARRLIGRLPGS
jgi:sporulation protein YlmC with PRC-barrel domain